VSLAVRVIPCLDVDRGRVVKGVNFAELRDAGDPVELARIDRVAEAEVTDPFVVERVMDAEVPLECR